MGLKTYIAAIIFLILLLPGGLLLWSYFGYDHPPSDHPASASVAVGDIQIDGGAHGSLISKSAYVLETRDGYYVFNLERRAQDSFTGRVMVSQAINEKSPIKRDVLSAKGFFADPEKVQWTVENHMFTPHVKSSMGRGDYILYRLSSIIYHLIPYRPYHLIPGSKEIAGIIDTIEVGDRLIVTGFDVGSFLVDAKNSNGVWADKGCRTMIVTKIEIS